VSTSTHPPDPIARFRDAIGRARPGAAFDVDRAALATADASGRPSVRFVLVRAYGESGFYFHTHYESRKAREIAYNPWAALAWHWESIGEQVRARGQVRRAPEEESDAYFRTRPRGSQIGAWASPQSQVIADRRDVEARVHETAKRFEGREVPRPPYWGGFVLLPEEIEFWINGESRLHDRHLYVRDGAGWRFSLLAP
jgi:pyridoxamine 5'-phosphate oxidase